VHIVSGGVQVITKLLNQIIKRIGKISGTSTASAKACHHAASQMVQPVDNGAGKIYTRQMVVALLMVLA